MSLRPEPLSCGLAAVCALLAACNDASPERSARPAVAADSKKSGAPAPESQNQPEARAPTKAHEARVVIEGMDGPVTVRVEVVRDPQARARGLMFRTHLDEDAGMVFVFEEQEVQVFWMRNTYIPLDMVFIGDDLRVVGVVENAEPRTDTSRSVDQPSQYVLEVNAGFARRHGIGPGTPVRFEGFER